MDLTSLASMFLPQRQPEQSLGDALAAAYERNKAVARPGPYATFLPPQQETAFRQWVAQNQVPFDPMASVADYDMRGFWQGLQMGDLEARTAIDPYDNQLHYPDTWKTPYHQTFSAESKYATPAAPVWVNDRLLSQGGRVLFDPTRNR